MSRNLAPLSPESAHRRPSCTSDETEQASMPRIKSLLINSHIQAHQHPSFLDLVPASAGAGRGALLFGF
jgi:hypothetical protein